MKERKMRVLCLALLLVVYMNMRGYTNISDRDFEQEKGELALFMAINIICLVWIGNKCQ